MPLKINKETLLEEFRSNINYNLKAIVLPDSKKEFVMALPTDLVLTSEAVAKITEEIPLVYDSSDGFIEEPKNFNLIQIPIIQNIHDSILQGLHKKNSDSDKNLGELQCSSRDCNSPINFNDLQNVLLNNSLKQVYIGLDEGQEIILSNEDITAIIATLTKDS